MLWVLRWPWSCSGVGRGFLRALVRDQRGEALIAPDGLLRDLRGRGRAIPCARGALPLRIIPDARGRRIRRVAPEPVHVTPAIIRDAGRRVELDRLERAHESPAQAEAVG